MNTLAKIINKKVQLFIIGCLDTSGILWMNRVDLRICIYSCVGYAYQRIPGKLKKRLKVQEPR